MSFEDNKTEMPDTNYNELENSRNNSSNNVDRSSDNERTTDNRLIEIIGDTRTSTSRVIVFLLALMPTLNGCNAELPISGSSQEIATLVSDNQDKRDRKSVV